MKLTDSDYKPVSRRKPVRFPSKKLPLIRIALLLGAAVAANLLINRLYDDTPAPGNHAGDSSLSLDSLAGRELSAGSGISVRTSPVLSSEEQKMFAWSEDSLGLVLVCAPESLRGCYDYLDSLAMNFGKSINALLDNRVMGAYSIGAEKILMKVLFSGERSSFPYLKEVVFRGREGERVFSAGNVPLDNAYLAGEEKSIGIRYCDKDGECLKSRSFSLPYGLVSDDEKSGSSSFDEIEAVRWPVPELKFTGGGAIPVRPVSRGRVVYLSSNGPDSLWIKLYHGDGLFSYYLRMGELKAGLLLGDWLDTSQTVGLPGRDGSGRAGFSLRLERHGVFVPPLEFLALPEGNRSEI
ncbi:hypothetical protein ACFL5V_10215 [Fibrobacterota bacterium]